MYVAGKTLSRAHKRSESPDITHLSSHSTDAGSFTVTLSFLPYFSAVTASVTSITLTNIPESHHGSFVEKSSLLHCLFEGDTGRTSPNSVVSFHIRKHGGDIFSTAVRHNGFPYKWVQRLCGISILSESPDATTIQPQADTSAEYIGTVVKVMEQRFIAQVNLTRQIVQISQG